MDMIVNRMLGPPARLRATPWCSNSANAVPASTTRPQSYAFCPNNSLTAANPKKSASTTSAEMSRAAAQRAMFREALFMEGISSVPFSFYNDAVIS